MKYKEFYKWSYKTTQNDFYLKEMEVYITTVLHRVLNFEHLCSTYGQELSEQKNNCQKLNLSKCQQFYYPYSVSVIERGSAL